MAQFEGYCDGACRVSNPGQAAAAWALYDGGVEIASGGRYLGPEVSNNVAEYLGLQSLLFYLAYHGIRRVTIFSDSALVVGQTNQTMRINKPELEPLALLCYGLLARGGHRLEHVDGHSGVKGNERADQICNEILDKEGM